MNKTSVLVWLRGSYAITVVTLLLLILSSLLPLASVVLLSEIVDSVQRETYADLPGLLLMSVVVFGLGAAASYFSAQMNSRLLNRISKNMRLTYYNKLQSLQLFAMQQRSSGELVSIYNNELNLLGEFLTGQMLSIISMGISFIVALTYVFQLHVYIVLSCVIPAFIAMLLVRWLSLRLNKRQSAFLKSTASQTNITTDGIYGRVEIQANNAQAWFLNKYERITNENVENDFKASRLENIIFCISVGQHNLSMVLSLAVGGLLAFYQVITVGQALAGFASFYYLCNPVRNLANYISRWQKGIASHRRVIEVMDMRDERNGGRSDFDESANPIASVRIEGFRYGDGAFSLSDVSIDIRRGQRIAIVGPSGCGKSTLAKLIAGYSEDFTGCINVMGLNSKEADLERLRERVLYVSNDYYLFSQTLRENMSSRGHGIDEISHALRLVEMDGFVASQPSGMEYAIQENGANVSGGERQRIILAIALMEKANLYILDEMFTAVGKAQREAIWKRILCERADDAFLIITHQTDILDSMDTVLYMRDGRIRAVGTHKELLSTDSDYQSFILAETETEAEEC